MWGLNFEAVLAQLAHCFKQGCVFSRSAWILVEISGQEEVGTSRHYTFPREFLVIESTFLPLTTNILEEWGQKHNFSFWAGRMAFICPPKFALRLLTGGEWMEGRPPLPRQIMQGARVSHRGGRANEPINTLRNGYPGLDLKPAIEGGAWKLISRCRSQWRLEIQVRNTLAAT